MAGVTRRTRNRRVRVPVSCLAQCARSRTYLIEGVSPRASRTLPARCRGRVVFVVKAHLAVASVDRRRSDWARRPCRTAAAGCVCARAVPPRGTLRARAQRVRHRTGWAVLAPSAAVRVVIEAWGRTFPCGNRFRYSR